MVDPPASRLAATHELGMFANHCTTSIPSRLDVNLNLSRKETWGSTYEGRREVDHPRPSNLTHEDFHLLIPYGGRSTTSADSGTVGLTSVVLQTRSDGIAPSEAKEESLPRLTQPGKTSGDREVNS